ncbi:FUSC family protein [Nocardioides aequoreus]|uniref:FUSC family protein n=1 Tax=Nocardioides aequoreus TaxID=397278 RepID=UPI000B16527B|nr:FUSC family protein [Nocardioides aequoreus]
MARAGQSGGERLQLPHHLGTAWDRGLHRGRTSMRQRRQRLRQKSFQVAQCAVAAGVAWFIADDLLDHPLPFFAPIAAVVSLGTSYGQRMRRVVEVAVGVALGVFLGDLVTYQLGQGALQLVLIVGVAMSVALLLDAGTLLVTQAAVQAIIVATLAPEPGDAFLRWTDALIGGGVALVAAAVVPRAPLRRPREQAGEVVAKVSTLLRAAADSITDGDVERALVVLADARSTDGLVRELRAAADEGLSVVRSSPFRRRHAGRVRAMAELVEPLDFALRNTRVLVRRVAVAAHHRRLPPPEYAALCRELADCSDAVAEELANDRLPRSVRSALVAFGRRTTEVERVHDLSSEVVLAQLRSITADLLAVCGMDPLVATDVIAPLD